MRMRGFAGAALVSILAAGCASDGINGSSITTQSLKQNRTAAAGAPAKSGNEKLRAFCAQRHIDHQEGKAPGGAKSLEQKMADDRACATLDM